MRSIAIIVLATGCGGDPFYAPTDTGDGAAFAVNDVSQSDASAIEASQDTVTYVPSADAQREAVADAAPTCPLLAPIQGCDVNEGPSCPRLHAVDYFAVTCPLVDPYPVPDAALTCLIAASGWGDAGRFYCCPCTVTP